MKKIPLYDSFHFALVSDEDFDELSQWNYFYKNGYAARSHHGKPIFMHREVANPPDNMIVDHINRNKLDNRRENLRVCTISQNRHNIGKLRNNTSGYKGVYKGGGKWLARISPNGRSVHIGTFDTPEQAARAYDEAAKKYHGEFAFLNFPQ